MYFKPKMRVCNRATVMEFFFAENIFVDKMFFLKYLWRVEYDGHDLSADMHEICASLDIPVPEVRLRTRSTPLYMSGWAYYREHRVSMILGPGNSGGRVLGLLLHECTHLATWRHLEITGHGLEFRALMVDNARALWGVRLDGWRDVRAYRGLRAYAIDHLLWAELDALRAAKNLW